MGFLLKIFLLPFYLIYLIVKFIIDSSHGEDNNSKTALKKKSNYSASPKKDSYYENYIGPKGGV